MDIVHEETKYEEGVTFEEFHKNFLCQEHVPKKRSGRRRKRFQKIEKYGLELEIERSR